MNDEVMLDNEEHAKSAREEHAVAKTLGWLVTAAVLLGIGWMAGGMWTGIQIKKKMEAAKGAENPMMAMMKMPGLIQSEEVALGVVNPPYAYIGRVEPIRDVGLRAQVDGYVKEVHFTEGAMVREGDLLFTIDPEPYEARVAARKAEVAQAEAALERAELLLSRLEAADPRAVTLMDVDSARGDVAQGRARVLGAQAGLTLAEIDLKHTRITSPMDGRVGRAAANVGDYVAPSIGTLLRIVQLDPIRVAFSVTDRDYVEARENIADEKLQETLRARVKLPTGTIPEMTGTRDFEDNAMSPGTASVSVRVRFPNAHGLLVPEGYVTVLVDLANPEPRPVVPVKALRTDGAGRYVWVVGADNTGTRRDVEVLVEDDGLAAVKGLSAGERVVVEHAIGGMKRLNAVAGVYLNRIPKTHDRLNLLAAQPLLFTLPSTQIPISQQV
ncbi:MAG: efflux RND transporter periplasmic adaptor subunit [Kiritimatiellaeota bacterium]|nr:efflux RND transporter periplasmic adaptor subunit [Kiritimatiellota bacterium]